MSIGISSNDVNVNDIYRICRGIAGTARDIKTLERAMEKIVSSQDELTYKYQGVPYENLEELTEEQLPTYTKGMNKSLKRFEKSVGKIVKSKNTKDIKFSASSSREGNVVYIEGEKGFKATTLIKQLIAQSIQNTRKQTMSTIAELNKQKYYDGLSKRIEHAEQQKTTAENVRKGREMYYHGMDNTRKIEERKAEVRGNIDFTEQLARETYGDTAVAYIYGEQGTKEAKKRLAELEGR